MCMDFDGHATLLHSRFQKARLAHKCTECGRQIDPGEKYLAERTVYDGRADSHKVCLHCDEVRDYLMDECGVWGYGAIEEDIQGHFWGSTANDAGTRRLRLLVIGMQEGWRRQNGQLWPVPRARVSA